MTYSCTSLLTCNATLPGPSLAEICGASAFIVFMSLLDELIRSNEKISGRCERVESIETPDEEYDFVVVGGGGAGAVVAARLSENPDWKVLLLEAGHDEPAGGQIPLFTGRLSGTEVDWNYTTTHEKHACLGGNGSCSASSGKMLGGGTSHNGMLYIRGVPRDYDNWADLGNEGWSWEEVKPFYLMSEDNGEIERVGRFDHGTGGLLSVERFPHLPALGYSILAASAELGYGISDDPNGENFTGLARVQATIKNGVRLSSASAYLRPVKNRGNLHVSLNSLATKAIVRNEKAIGVEYYQNGERKTVRVSKEVVVSAGAIMSPRFLLLSGIGPKAHLDSVGVKVVNDRPGVGENFHNHVGYNLSFTVDDADGYDNDWAIATEYLVNRTGPLSGIGISSVLGNLKTESSSPDFPDVKLAFYGYSQSCTTGEIGALRSSGKRNVYVTPIYLHPKSRGRISLASNDPFEYPVIRGNYLADPRDVAGVYEAVKKALALADTEALRGHNFTLTETPVEACSGHAFLGDDYWRCVIRQNTYLEHHFSGTCKMGPISDPMAVVDPRLRVHGIKGLRVADASVMPQVTSGNTAAPVMMIGERAADFIKTDWARKPGENTSTQRNSSEGYLKRNVGGDSPK